MMTLLLSIFVTEPFQINDASVADHTDRDSDDLLARHSGFDGAANLFDGRGGEFWVSLVCCRRG